MCGVVVAEWLCSVVVTVCCSVMQRDAVCCSVLQCVAVCVAVCSSLLQSIFLAPLNEVNL